MKEEEETAGNREAEDVQQQQEAANTESNLEGAAAGDSSEDDNDDEEVRPQGATDGEDATSTPSPARSSSVGAVTPDDKPAPPPVSISEQPHAAAEESSAPDRSPLEETAPAKSAGPRVC
jgi:hypothetical protein